MTTDEERITYACSTCGATECKLWRPAQTFSAPLRCANCVAERDETTNLTTLDSQGKSTPIDIPEHRTYCLGGYHVPAVPAVGWTTFWGYLAIPPEGLAWWHYLPTFPVPKPEPKPESEPEFVCSMRRHGCSFTGQHSHAPYEINNARLDAIARGAERGDPMG